VRAITIGIILFTLFVAAASLDAKEYTFDYHRVIEPKGEVTLDLSYLEGDLIVIGHDLDQIIINGTKRINAVSLDEAEVVQGYVEIKTRETGDVVTVVANYLKMRNRGRSFWQKLLGMSGDDSYGEIDWQISLPDYCNLVVTNISGKIDISHIRGSVTIRSSASDITVSSIEGDLNIENSSGILIGELIFGNIDIRQPRGEISLKWIEGNVRLRSSSANIHMHQERGSIDLTTNTGRVEIQTNLESSNDYWIFTESGNVHFSIPESSSGELDIRTESGEIKTEIPIAIKSMSRSQVIGEFGYGGIKVTVSSVSGDVTVAAIRISRPQIDIMLKK